MVYTVFIDKEDINSSIENLTKYYNSYENHRGCFNGSLGQVYSLRKDVIYPLGCNSWSCPRFRKRKKYQLYQDTFYNVENFGLDKHFIMTFQGEEFRSKFPFYETYRIMQTIWNKYRKVIEYKQGKLDYIIFPRAQKDGCCHFHVIMNRRIQWKWLNEKRKKYPELGFVSISKNQNVAEYLHRDFFKDNEYVIPLGFRHYSSSRNIKFNKYYDPYFQDDNIVLDKRVGIYVKEKNIEDKFGRLLPFEEYLKEFVTKKVEVTENGLKEIYRIKNKKYIKNIGYT